MELLIGQVARQAGVGIETVRYYERRGLLGRPKRNTSGYRRYNHDSVQRLKFIRRAKKLGFSLNDIKTLLNLRLGVKATRADVKAQALAKVSEIAKQIADLQQIQEALESLIHQRSGCGPLLGCPILDALSRSSADGDE